MRFRILIAVSVVLVLAGFGYYKIQPQYKKLGEKVFFKDENIELKIVYIYENLFLHYNGPHVSVACRSASTTDLPGDRFSLIEKGWASIPEAVSNFNSTRSTSEILDELAENATSVYRVIDEKTVITIRDGGELFISFNGCRSFIRWEMTLIPSSTVFKASDEYDACVQRMADEDSRGLKSYGDCFHTHFSGTQKVKFENISGDRSGRVSFEVKSNAFSGIFGYAVSSIDFGKNWQYRALQTR